MDDELTVVEDTEEHPEAAKTAGLIRPHSHYSKTGVQHDIISNRTTKLGLKKTTHLFL